MPIKSTNTANATQHLPHVIVAGDIVNGFTLYGPYQGPVSAIEAADDADLKEPWVVVPLHQSITG